MFDISFSGNLSLHNYYFFSFKGNRFPSRCSRKSRQNYYHAAFQSQCDRSLHRSKWNSKVRICCSLENSHSYSRLCYSLSNDRCCCNSCCAFRALDALLCFVTIDISNYMSSLKQCLLLNGFWLKSLFYFQQNNNLCEFETT